MQRQAIAIHFVEKARDFENLRCVSENLDEWETGYWPVKDFRAESLIGGMIYVHRGQKLPSHIGGEILSFHHEPGSDEGRKVFRFRSMASAKNLTTDREGWGNQMKIVWRDGHNKSAGKPSASPRDQQPTATYLLSWMPDKKPWDDLAEKVRDVEKKGNCEFDWCCGNTKKIKPGDRVFMLRQGSDSPGIMGAGWATSQVYEGAHYDDARPDDTALYIDVCFDTLLNPDTTEVLRRKDLPSGPVARNAWNTKASGITISPEVAAELEASWAAHLSQLGWVGAREAVLQSPENETPPERIASQINRIIRDTAATKKLKAHYQYRCQVCNLQICPAPGRYYIEVHHIQPLGGSHKGKDDHSNMLVLCPNHHAMFDLCIPRFLSPTRISIAGERFNLSMRHTLSTDVRTYYALMQESRNAPENG